MMKASTEGCRRSAAAAALVLSRGRRSTSYVPHQHYRIPHMPMHSAAFPPATPVVPRSTCAAAFAGCTVNNLSACTRTRCIGPHIPRNFASSSDNATSGSSDESAGGWTIEREKRLRSILSGKADVPSNLDLAKEARLAASWYSTSGKISDLNRLVGRAEKYAVSYYRYNNDTSIIPYEPAIMILLRSSAAHPEYLLDADKMMNSLLWRLNDGNRPVSFRTVNDLLGHMVTAWGRCRDNIVRPAAKNKQRRNGKAGASHTSSGIVPADAAEAWLRRWVDIVLDRNTKLLQDQDEDRSTSVEVNVADDSPNLGPGALVFGAVIDAHAKSRSEGSARRAEALLEWMIALEKSNSDSAGSYDTGWVPPRPNAVMYTSLIDAWSRSAHHTHDAVENAERWLTTMEESYFEDGVVDAKPSVMAYSAIIMAHARSGERRRRRKEEMAREDGEVSPAERAESVLLRLLRHNEQYVDRDQEQQRDVLVEIDVNIINGIIDAWARQVGTGSSGEENFNTALRAERWLALLLSGSSGYTADSTDMGQDDAPVPTSAIIASHIRTENDSVHDSNSTLFESLSPMIAASMITPDVISFNSTINAFSRVRRSTEAAKRAQRCLNAMREQSINPTSVTFGSIVQAWGNTCSSKGAIESTGYLDEYEQLGRYGRLDPHVIVYNNCLNAWADSERNDSLSKMKTIIDRMENYSDNGIENTALVPPDIVSYHTFLKAITARAWIDPTDAFAHFLAVFDTLSGEDDRVIPESSTFVSILLCVDKCVPSPKDRHDVRYLVLLRTVFERCCQHGLVSAAVVGTLRSALPPDNRAFADMLGVNIKYVDEEKNIKTLVLSLPPEWRRNLYRKQDRGGRGRTHGSATKWGRKHSKDMRLSSRQHLSR